MGKSGDGWSKWRRRYQRLRRTRQPSTTQTNPAEAAVNERHGPEGDSARSRQENSEAIRIFEAAMHRMKLEESRRSATELDLRIREATARFAQAVRVAEEAASRSAGAQWSDRDPEDLLREADARLAEARRAAHLVNDLRAMRESQGLARDLDMVQEEFIRILNDAVDRLAGPVRAAQEATSRSAMNEPQSPVRNPDQFIREAEARLAEARRAAEEAANSWAMDVQRSAGPEDQLREAEARLAEARRAAEEAADLRAIRERQWPPREPDLLEVDVIRNLNDATDLLAEAVRAAQEAAGRTALDSGFEQRTPDSDDTWWVIDEPLSSEDEQRVAEETADSINYTLAWLLVRLGPPPPALGVSVVPVSSGDGGSAR